MPRLYIGNITAKNISNDGLLRFFKSHGCETARNATVVRKTPTDAFGFIEVDDMDGPMGLDLDGYLWGDGNIIVNFANKPNNNKRKKNKNKKKQKPKPKPKPKPQQISNSALKKELNSSDKVRGVSGARSKAMDEHVKTLDEIMATASIDPTQNVSSIIQGLKNEVQGRKLVSDIVSDIQSDLDMKFQANSDDY